MAKKEVQVVEETNEEIVEYEKRDEFDQMKECGKQALVTGVTTFAASWIAYIFIDSFTVIKDFVVQKISERKQ